MPRIEYHFQLGDYPQPTQCNKFVCEFEAEGRGHAGGSDSETLFPRGEFLDGTRRGQISPDSVGRHLLRANEEVHKAEVLVVAGTKIKHHVAFNIVVLAIYELNLT